MLIEIVRNKIILETITKLNKNLSSVKVNLNSSFGGGP